MRQHLASQSSSLKRLAVELTRRRLGRGRTRRRGSCAASPRSAPIRAPRRWDYYAARRATKRVARHGFEAGATLGLADWVVSGLSEHLLERCVDVQLSRADGRTERFDRLASDVDIRVVQSACTICLAGCSSVRHNCAAFDEIARRIGGSALSHHSLGDRAPGPSAGPSLRASRYWPMAASQTLRDNAKAALFITEVHLARPAYVPRAVRLP